MELAADNQPPADRPTYWREAQRPLVSLLFVAPLLLTYEIGMVWLGPTTLRNGADVWLRRTLDTLGFGHLFLLPALLCGVLLGWHHIRRDPWRADARVLIGMLIESLAFALLLLAIAQSVMSGRILPWSLATSAPAPRLSAQLVGYCGAGIYEELLFRLVLLPLLCGCLLQLRAKRSWAIAGSVLLSSAVFAAAHYEFAWQFAGQPLISNYGEPFAWPSFVFRVAAGVFFGVLLVYRGFGITAGAHALYDMLTCIH